MWTLLGLLATALFTLLGGQMRGLEKRVCDVGAEMHRGFGEIRGDIAVLRAQINRDQG